MLSKFSVSVISVLIGFAAAQTDDPLCCNTFIPAESSRAQEVLDLAGIFFTNYNFSVGIECFPSDGGTCTHGFVTGCKALTTAPLLNAACINV
ncbi:hypothetical protein B0H14DRAFT_3487906 [Mycena olivaceomarginata]|nr:hypothetical protein B0H14DRAFT_3487906 [Mycena olivaceomarginata]